MTVKQKISTPTKTTVLLCGHHPLLRAFLKAWLARFDHLQVVAETQNYRQTVEVLKKTKAALVLMDFDSLKAEGLDLLAKIRLAFPNVKVIVYFAFTNGPFAVQAIRAGAGAFVLKSSESEDMETAIKTVLSGGVYLSADFLKSLSDVAATQGVLDKSGKALSARQTQVLKLVAVGLSTKAVAYELKISSKTVDVHKQALEKRLGVDGTTGLVKFAIRAGLVPA